MGLYCMWVRAQQCKVPYMQEQKCKKPNPNLIPNQPPKENQEQGQNAPNQNGPSIGSPNLSQSSSSFVSLETSYVRPSQDSKLLNNLRGVGLVTGNEDDKGEKSDEAMGVNEPLLAPSQQQVQTLAQYRQMHQEALQKYGPECPVCATLEGQIKAQEQKASPLAAQKDSTKIESAKLQVQKSRQANLEEIQRQRQFHQKEVEDLQARLEQVQLSLAQKESVYETEERYLQTQLAHLENAKSSLKLDSPAVADAPSPVPPATPLVTMSHFESLAEDMTKAMTQEATKDPDLLKETLNKSFLRTFSGMVVVVVVEVVVSSR